MGRGSAGKDRADLPLALLILRQARGLTQKQLAKAAGSTAACISRYESGKAQPGRRTLLKLLWALDLPLSILEETVALIIRLRGAVKL